MCSEIQLTKKENQQKNTVFSTRSSKSSVSINFSSKSIQTTISPAVTSAFSMLWSMVETFSISSAAEPILSFKIFKE
jgi:hypothetical protein